MLRPAASTVGGDDVALAAVHPDGQRIEDAFRANEFLGVNARRLSIPDRAMTSSKIQVFHLALAADVAPVESDGTAVGIENRNDNAVVELLVALGVDES